MELECGTFGQAGLIYGPCTWRSRQTKVETFFEIFLRCCLTDDVSFVAKDNFYAKDVFQVLISAALL